MNAIVTEALTWLGTRHVNGAKVKGVGVDCGMLLIGSLEGAGLVKRGEIQIKPYSNEWHLHHSEEWFKGYVEQYCQQVHNLQEGDFLMFQYGRCLSHAGIYIGNNTVIHSVVDQGVILTALDDVMFKDNKGNSRLRCIYRFGGDGDGHI